MAPRGYVAPSVTVLVLVVYMVFANDEGRCPLLIKRRKS
jgi:hypothetical protein